MGSLRNSNSFRISKWNFPFAPEEHFLWKLRPQQLVISFGGLQQRTAKIEFVAGFGIFNLVCHLHFATSLQLIRFGTFIFVFFRKNYFCEQIVHIWYFWPLKLVQVASNSLKHKQLWIILQILEYFRLTLCIKCPVISMPASMSIADIP